MWIHIVFNRNQEKIAFLLFKIAEECGFIKGIGNFLDLLHELLFSGC